MMNDIEIMTRMRKMMELEDAIRLSSIRVAVRPALINLGKLRGRKRKKAEQELRAWEQPAVATRNLIKFHHQTAEPVYSTFVWNHHGQAFALALAKQRALPDWEPLDPADLVTAMADLLTREEIERRQRRITDRKKALGMEEGKEWSCLHLFGILENPEGVAAQYLSRQEAIRQDQARWRASQVPR